MNLWRPAVLWRGVLYASLMAIGKVSVGFPILVWSNLPRPHFNVGGCRWARRNLKFFRPHTKASMPTQETRQQANSTGSASPAHGEQSSRTSQFSYAPAIFIGIAMIARGEIGLLIAQVARGGSDDMSGGQSLLGEEAFLVCVWAILLCTLVGPIGVGIIVRRWEGRIRHGIWG